MAFGADLRPIEEADGPGQPDFMFAEDIALRDTVMRPTELQGSAERASGSAALPVGCKCFCVHVLAANDHVQFCNELQYVRSTDWREDGAQIFAFLDNGNIYGGYKQWLALREPWKMTSRTVGLLIEGDFLFAFVDDRVVFTLRDPQPEEPRLLCRVHGWGHVRLVAPPQLRPTALGWTGIGGDGHITLCWGGEYEPRPMPSLFNGATITFVVESRWADGGGYNLNGSRSVADCVDQARFRCRNDGESPGASDWWHCTGGDLDKFIGLELPGEFSRETLMPF